MYEFSKTDKQSKVSVVLRHPDQSLPDVLHAFEDFLRAAGFVFAGQIEIIDDSISEDDPQ